MSPTGIAGYIDTRWRDSIVPELVEYIRIPNQSPHFDPDWAAHGYMDAVAARFEAWARSARIPEFGVEIVRLQGRTPVLLCVAPGRGQGTVLLYGHLDKQPEMHGWRAGLGPWTPVIDGDRLYGRGGADDGYALFACIAAIEALAAESIAYGRCVILIEACEESGSYDLPHYIDALAARIGTPDLVVCLDSGCGNYEQLWCTTSLRGLASGVLRVAVLDEGVHSGDATGIVPSSFRIARQLLARIEDHATGAILPAAFHAPIPEERSRQAAAAAQALGDQVAGRFPFVAGAGAIDTDPATLILNRTWRPGLEVIGAEGLPSLASAGNVLRPATSLRLSLRLPPTCDATRATEALRELLERDPPYGAAVRFEPDWAASGWNAPPLAPWLGSALERASRRFFGKPSMYMGEGGSIPFMAMLGARYPRAQFLITGVLGPQANAHGPNEFLHLPTARRLSCCVAEILAAHAARS
jgi:acetylornithine deacetylase/succinyl-diaminopimelate desuccinylase-like protein